MFCFVPHLHYTLIFIANPPTCGKLYRMAPTRTSQQNKSLWLFYQLLADSLNAAGLDMRVVLKPEVDIPWNKDTVHDYLWIPIQKAYLRTDSTTKLGKHLDIEEIHAILMRHLGEKFGVEYIQFPSINEADTTTEKE